MRKNERLQLELERELLIRRSRHSFRSFVTATMQEYEWNWHHKYLCLKLDQLEKGEISRLMVFMPPRHGKSQLCSRHFPAFCLGRNPDRKIIAASYSADLASDMNSDCQKVMDTQEYSSIFPESTLSRRRVVTLTLPKRNRSRFDIVGHKGYYVSAGVGGAITGKGADIAIIDDPVKNSEEAESITYRERVWKWWGSTLYTRLEKNAKVLLIMTRWHEDDLAGRILKQAQENPEADQWDVVRFPAIKTVEVNPNDPRKIHEPLWPTKYDKAKMDSIRVMMGTRYWTSLYQQQPAPQEGAIIKRNWFETFQRDTMSRGAINFYIDGAYTDKTQNDPTAILSWWSDGHKMYLNHCITKHLNFPDLIQFLPNYLKAQGYGGASRVYIEPKASGQSIAQELRSKTTINIIEDEPPKDSKLTRVHASTAVMEAGRVLVPIGEGWVEAFMMELAQFPNGTNDDRVDCLTGAIRITFPSRSPISMSGIIH